MNSCKAVSNGQGHKASRLGVLSLVTWMVVSLSMGTALAADNFKLWKLKDGKAGELVSPVTVGIENDAVTLITKPDVKDFISKFHSEPTHLLAGARKALLSVKADEKKVEAMKKSLVEEFKKASVRELGLPKKEALVKLMEKLESIPTKDLEEMTESELLEALLKDEPELLKALGLTDTNEEENKDGDTDIDKPAPIADPVTPKPEPTEPGLSQQQQQQQQPVGTGEVVDDSALLAMAQQICDRFNSIRDNANDQFAGIKDLLNESFNRLRALSAQPQLAQQQQKREDDNIVPELLKALGQDQEQPQITPPQAPQVAQVAPQQEEPQRNSILDQPIPQQPLPEQAPLAPFIPAPQSSTQRPQIALDLPTNTGARELRQTQDAVAQAEELASREMPQLVNPLTGQMMVHPFEAARILGAQKAEVEGALATLKSSEQSTKDRVARLDDQLEQLKEGGRSALPAWVKREQTRLQNQFDEAKRNFEQNRQALTAQAQQDPNAQAQVAQTLGGMAQEMNRAENELKQFNSEVEIQVEQGNKAIARLKTQRDRLEDSLNEVKGKRGQLEARRSEISNMLNQNQMTVLGSQQQQSQGANVNRILGAAPRPSTGAGLGGAMRSPVTPTGVRGTL